MIPMEDTPTRYQVQFLSGAKSDLRSIRNYIEDELCNRAAAMRTVDSIFETARALEIFPYRNKAIGFSDTGAALRLARSGNYALLYVIEGDLVKVIAVLYGKSDLETRIEGLMNRE